VKLVLMASRPKRKTTKKAAPSEYYLGYAEDGETPEMIMKKFETLERVKNESKGEETLITEEQSLPSQSAILSQSQLETLFKETSNFSVEESAAIWEESEDVEFEGFFSDEEQFFDEEGFWDDEEYEDSELADKFKRKRKFVAGASSMRELVSCEVTSEDGYVYTFKKKVRYVDPNMPIYVRIPPLPVPMSWAKTILPFSTVESQPSKKWYIESQNVKTMILDKVFQTKFLAALIDPPWKLSSSSTSLDILPNELEKLNISSLIPNGYIFMWVEKELITEAVLIMNKLKFTYVENLVWVKQSVNNRVITQNYKYFKKSKASLLIFKKGEGIELRHQRNPDVVFDFVRQNKGITEDKPDFVYRVIETLLPTAQYDEPTDTCKLLELWGKKGTQRRGWAKVVQI